MKAVRKGREKSKLLIIKLNDMQLNKRKKIRKKK